MPVAIKRYRIQQISVTNFELRYKFIRRKQHSLETTLTRNKCNSLSISNKQWNLLFAGIGLNTTCECVGIYWGILYLEILTKESSSAKTDFRFWIKKASE